MSFKSEAQSSFGKMDITLSLKVSYDGKHLTFPPESKLRFNHSTSPHLPLPHPRRDGPFPCRSTPNDQLSEPTATPTIGPQTTTTQDQHPPATRLAQSTPERLPKFYLRLCVPSKVNKRSWLAPRGTSPQVLSGATGCGRDRRAPIHYHCEREYAPREPGNRPLKCCRPVLT